LKLPFSRAVPWLLFGAVLMPALATAVVGVVILALWTVPRDIVLGVLTLVFSAFVLAGTIVAVTMLWRQHRLARMQSDFIAHVSHELRTPLSSIRMYVDTLRLGRVSSPAETGEFLEALARETTRLSGLVEQLLGFRHATRGGGGPREPAAPEALVRDAVAPFRCDPAVGPRLAVAIDPGLPAVHVDGAACVGALANLMRNAVAYGGDGGISVSVRAEGDEVVFEVTDRGPASPRGTGDASSGASCAAGRPVTAHSRAWAWGCRSSASSPRRTADASRWTPRSAAGARSRSACPRPWRAQRHETRRDDPGRRGRRVAGPRHRAQPAV